MLGRRRKGTSPLHSGFSTVRRRDTIRAGADEVRIRGDSDKLSLLLAVLLSRRYVCARANTFRAFATRVWIDTTNHVLKLLYFDFRWTSVNIKKGP